MANIWNQFIACISLPFSIPFAINKNSLDAFVSKAWGESRVFQIAVELPAIRQVMHLFTSGAPMSIPSLGAAKSAAYLAHHLHSLQFFGFGHANISSGVSLLSG